MRRRSFLAIGVGLVAGCASSSLSGSGTTTLTYMTFDSPDLTPTFWKNSIRAAQSSVHGLTIKQVVCPSTDRDAYAKQLEASGQFPDLLESITPSEYTSAGLLTPYPQSWIDANFLDPTGNAIGGKVYIPPTNSQIIPMVYYNKKLFAQAGITSAPSNWAEFLAACAKLKSHGITPIELGGNTPFAAAMPLTGTVSANVLGNNPDWIKQRHAGKVKFSDPDVVAAAQEMRTLVTEGYFNQGALNVSYAQSITNFNEGKAAMYPMGSWYLGSIPKSEWDNIGVFLWPSDSGKQVVPFSVGGSMAISSKAPDQSKAFAFAEAWSLNPSNLKTLIEGDGAFPMLKGKTLADFNVTVSRVYSESYAYVTAANDKVDSMGWATSDDALPGSLNDDFYAAAQNLFNTSDVKSVMAQLDSDWESANQSS